MQTLANSVAASDSDRTVQGRPGSEDDSTKTATGGTVHVPTPILPAFRTVLRRYSSARISRDCKRAHAHAGESDEREDELEEYYARGSHYGIPASVILFRLAHQLQHNAGHLLWCGPPHSAPLRACAPCPRPPPRCFHQRSSNPATTRTLAVQAQCGVCRMAVLGLTEQLLLRRAHAASPHYVHAHAQLEAFCEELSAGDREQGLFDEEFGSDEEEDLNAPRVRGRSAQGRIRCARPPSPQPRTLRRARVRRGAHCSKPGTEGRSAVHTRAGAHAGASRRRSCR